MKMTYDKDSGEIVSETGDVVLDMYDTDFIPGLKKCNEYGHKFAAVDDLLEALDRIVTIFDSDHVPNSYSIDQARAAIAKAKGEA